MANKVLKTSVKLDTKQAERSLDALEKKIRSVQDAIDKQNKVINNVNKTTNKLTTANRKLVNTNNKLASSANKAASAHRKQASSMGILTKQVHRLASAYLGIMGARAVVNASDTITHAENRFNNLPGGNPKTTQSTMNKMFTSSQGARTDYAGMMNNVSKSMTLASKAFGGDIDNAIRFQEIMAKSYTLGGASQGEQHSSMYQMIQGLGSGILQGDELRSVREGAPLAYKAIEEFAQGIYGAEENLKDLASQGKITSDIVVAAIMASGEDVDKRFEETAMTFDQAFTMIKNTALKSFEPVLQMMNKALNSDAGKAVINGIGKAIQFVAGVLQVMFTIIGGIYNFIADNWGVISKILMSIGVIIAIAIIPKFVSWLRYLVFVITYYTYVGAVAIASAIKVAIGWMAANIPLLIMIAILATIVITLIWVSDSFVDACGIIVGVAFAAGAILWNIVVGLVNGIIQYLWTYFVEPWIGIIEWVLNVFNGGFNSFGDAVKNLLGNIISWFLSLGKIVTKIIDAIFGTNWTGGLNALQDNLLSWGKNEKAITLDRKAPEVLQRVSVGDAYNKGYGYGVTGGQWISNKASGAKDWLSDKLNLGLPNEVINPSGVGDISKGIGNIDDNTGAMVDSMQLAQEDLEYLRKVANMEWKKEFTTATIQVDMSNYNTVNGESDLDGIVTKLTDKLYEELNVVANGVYV